MRTGAGACERTLRDVLSWAGDDGILRIMNGDQMVGVVLRYGEDVDIPPPPPPAVAMPGRRHLRPVPPPRRDLGWLLA